jgi:hypothetical protein
MVLPLIDFVENATPIGLEVPAAAKPAVSSLAVTVPWYCFVIVFAATCIPIGVLWDISWHQSIGRDTFWTPAHMVIYLGGALPGMVCGWMVLKATFWGTPADRERTVSFLGFHGSLGAWVIIWGSIAMLTSAPFDDWWHNAYGLDVKILSPPHTLLAIGMFSVTLGALLLVLSWQNRLPEAQRRVAAGLFVFMGGILLTMQSLFLTEHTFPNQQHTSVFYKASAVLFPAIMVSTARASTMRWPAVFAALTYMGVCLFMIWMLPLFPAQAKLAPIYNPISRMVTLPFPLLMVVPAFAIDLVMQYSKSRSKPPTWWSDWLLAAVLAVVFVALLVPVQWHFSSFLLTPAARNWFFASDRIWGFSMNMDYAYRFWHENDKLTTTAVFWTLGIAWLSARFGLWRGAWMRQVQR